MLEALVVFGCVYVQPVNPRSRLDGDTFRCSGDVSPIIPDVVEWTPKVRLVRINAPETGKPGAEEARTTLIGWLSQAPFNLVCFDRDKYGRLLADAEGVNGLLSQYMLDSKLVTPMSLSQARNLMPDASTEMLTAIVHPDMRRFSPDDAC